MVYNTGITGFLEFVHCLVFQRAQRFEKWLYFRPQVRGWVTPAVLDPLKRSLLNHWT
jgi:hypothetical protein